VRSASTDRFDQSASEDRSCDQVDTTGNPAHRRVGLWIAHRCEDHGAGKRRHGCDGAKLIVHQDWCHLVNSSPEGVTGEI
jgi:hypothetical protein